MISFRLCTPKMSWLWKWYWWWGLRHCICVWDYSWDISLSIYFTTIYISSFASCIIRGDMATFWWLRVFYAGMRPRYSAKTVFTYIWWFDFDSRYFWQYWVQTMKVQCIGLLSTDHLLRSYPSGTYRPIGQTEWGIYLKIFQKVIMIGYQIQMSCH